MPKILAIDDKEDNLISLSAVLKSLIPGCIVTTARSGPEGIEKAKIESPDTILLDIKMPGMDGYEICKRLKEDKDTRHIPVIMISAILTESKDFIQGLDTGADAYLTKPINEHVLVAQVKTSLRMKAAEDSLRGQKDVLEEMVRERTAELTNSNIQLKREIDERKKTEEELRQRTKLNQMLLDALPCVALLVRPDTREIVASNKAGRKAGAVPGAKCYETWGQRSDPCPWCLAPKVWATAEPQHLEVDALTVIWDAHWYPIDDDLYLHYAFDITEQRNLEKQFLQSQKMEAIGTLAGGVAHDFNNILTTIIGNADLALMDIGKHGSLREKIEEIRAAGERAATLTRQLLVFSRKQIIQPKILDLNGLLTDIEKMLGRLIGEDVELLTIPEPELWQVEIDPGQMEQVIMNLVINARDAMPMGGKLTIETANMDLDKNYFREHGIKENQPGTYVMLAVSDVGSGMDPETQEHIFEPFYTTKEKDKGTGLGLSTVYGIVKQNNGFIWVYSESGQGTTFKIYFPKAKGGVVSEKKEQTAMGEVIGTETVLIVEDDDSLRNFACKTLRHYGYKILEAEDGEVALKVSEAHDGSIDLLITDVVMPKLSGKKIAERLQPLYPHMKVIYMSGYTDDAIVHHGVLAPGLNFLEKPFSPDVLARKVREVLDD